MSLSRVVPPPLAELLSCAHKIKGKVIICSHLMYSSPFMCIMAQKWVSCNCSASPEIQCITSLENGIFLQYPPNDEMEIANKAKQPLTKESRCQAN